MSTVADKVISHVNDNKHIYRDPRNIVTLVLWGIALASHAILMPILIRELYEELFKGKK